MGTLPAVTAPSPVPLCLHPGKHGRHLCHHGGAARTGKEAIVDNGARFEPQSGSLNSVIPPAVQHLTVEVSAADGQYLAQAKWDTPRVVKGVRFSLRLTSGKGTDARLVTTAITADTEHRFSGLPLGEYTLTVRAINSYGQQGEPATTTFRIAAPAAPSRIELTPGYFSDNRNATSCRL